jgi:hypothetical protein
MILHLDFAHPQGRLRALHGVGNGPVVNGSHTTDMAVWHREAAFPSVRLHDCHWPNPNVVDINTIFPLFHADETNPKNYIFAPTDRYLAAIAERGVQIVYRLGVSIEHLTKFFIYPPADYDKWARICINIIRHYNDGWADGFHYGITHFEIWNEPNVASMWQGTEEEYFTLYRTAVLALKAYNPVLKVGGPVSTHVGADLVPHFLAYCREQQLTLDFFSWHCYTDDPAAFVDNAVRARALLDEYGYPEAESHCTEWRPMLIGWDEISPKPERPPHAVRDGFARNRNAESAAYTAAALMRLQDAPIDMTHFYCADDSPWSMFDEYGVPGRVYYALKAFNALVQTPNRVAITGDAADGITACAGVADDGRSGAVLLSNYRGAAHTVTLAGLPAGEVECFLLDEGHELTSLGVTANTGTLTIDLPPSTVVLVKVGAV